MIFMTIVLTSFTKFHVKLVCTNVTTIENLEKDRTGEFVSYDVGIDKNFKQVFGENPWLWPLPFYGSSGRPSGDGVKWISNTYQH